MSTSTQWLLATFITTGVWHVLVCSRSLIKFIIHSRCIRNLASPWLTSYVYTTFNLGTKQEVAYQMRYKTVKLNRILLRSDQLDLTFLTSLNACLFSVTLYCSSKLYYLWDPELVIFVQSGPLASMLFATRGVFLHPLWPSWNLNVSENSYCFFLLGSIDQVMCLALGIQSQVI